MERSFSVGAGNSVQPATGSSLPGATDVKGVADLDDAGALRPVRKRLLLDLDDLGLTLDNLEGMTLGPRLPVARTGAAAGQRRQLQSRRRRRSSCCSRPAADGR